MSSIDSAAGTIAGPDKTSVYFDGSSSRRRAVALVFARQLELRDPSGVAAVWPLCRYPPRR